ncbi:MAG: hypothetical protein ACYSRZ_04240 [Planctomycetota bacterium]|jgi:hypothetical protein
MKTRICIEVSIASQVQEFLNIEGIEIEVVTNGNCDVTVVRCKDRKECDLNTIYSGGSARALAKKSAIPVRQMGKLLDYLDVKIRRCSLGCFK